MSKDPGYAEVSRDTYVLKAEINRLRDLVEIMKKDYVRDMERKDKKIKFLEDECKRIYDPIREFWNIEKNEEMERLRKEVEVLKNLSPEVPERYIEIENSYEAVCNRLSQLNFENDIMKRALVDAAEYSGKDDVNGEAGRIAEECFIKLFG